jgi:release factor glutamine methyltransferase
LIRLKHVYIINLACRTFQAIRTEERTNKPALKIFSRATSGNVRYRIGREHTVRLKDLSITVKPGVFHPTLFFSTKILADYIQTLDIAGRSLLEFGAGSGAIACLAAKMGAHTSALDINPVAVETIRENAGKNAVSINVWQSDFFDNVPAQQFDAIIINPPYFPLDPKNNMEKAWLCGKDFDYFETLFSQLPKYTHSDSTIVIILSEDCDIDRIKSIAGDHKISMELEETHRGLLEDNYIFHANCKH